MARENPGYRHLGGDDCGRRDLAGKSVAVPFVGTCAATLVVAEAVRLLHDGPAYLDIKLGLGNPAKRLIRRSGNYTAQDAAGLRPVRARGFSAALAADRSSGVGRRCRLVQLGTVRYVYDFGKDLDTEPLVKIPSDHFMDFEFDPTALAQLDNYELFTGKIGENPSAWKGWIFRDLHVNADQARAWLAGAGRPPPSAEIAVRIKTAGAKIDDFRPVCALVSREYR
jgi:hypothetical protein